MNRFKRKALRVYWLLLYIVIIITIIIIFFLSRYSCITSRKCKQVIADFLSTEEVEDIKELFRKIDTDNDGIVSVEELRSGLQMFGSQMAEPEVQMLIEAVSRAFALF